MRANHSAISILAWLYRLLRWSLGSIFIYSGVTKLMDPITFAVLIDAYGLVPEALLMPVALILPVLEIIAGAGLMVDIRGSLAMILALLLLFVAILGYGMELGLDVDCGCFGPDDPEAKAFHGLQGALYRDMAMLVAVALLYGWRRYHHLQPIGLSTLIGKQSLSKTEEAHV